MKIYKYLIGIYLFSFIALIIASLMGIDFQVLSRIPIINIRFIDIIILIISITYFLKIKKSNEAIPKSTNFLFRIIFIVILFDIFQLIRTFGIIDAVSQFGLFSGALAILILPCLYYKTNEENIYKILNYFGYWGAVTFCVFIFGQLIAMSIGRVDVNKEIGGERVMIFAEGLKETISISVLLPIVLLFSFFKNKLTNISQIQKLVFLFSLNFVFLYIVTSYHRGTLFTFIVALLFYIFSNLGKERVTKKFVYLTISVVLFFIIFEGPLKSMGFSPMEVIPNNLSFSVDIDNPNWDKGRSLSRAVAVSVWLDNFYVGIGFDELANYGLPKDMATAHNYIISSLVHRGIVGTLLYLTIFILIIIKGVQLWKKTKYLDDNKSILIKILLISSLLWIIPFWTQEIIWERYSTSVQYVLFAVIIKLNDIYNHKMLKNEGLS